MRLAVYGVSTTVLASALVLSAFHRRPNFYSVCVYLAQSNASLMILTNMSIFLTVLFGRLVQMILFGALRAIEIEHLYERAWYAVTETCLAMTIFRDEFDARFVIMFTTLLFLKIFHWLCSDRVEYMEQQQQQDPAGGRTFAVALYHVRMSTALLLINFVDLWLIRLALNNIFTHGPNMMVMFAFEFAILATSAIGVTGRYVLNLVEIRINTQAEREEQRRREEQAARAGADADPFDDLDGGAAVGWERKGEFIFYLELATDFIKLLIYLSFFMLVLTVYGLPLHIIRDVYLTLRSFITRIRDFMRYRKATSQMNSRYPDATEAEVARESTCIICREEMVAYVPAADDRRSLPERMRPKKLPCGHILHFGCLRSWLERQQRCPTCRRPVLDGVEPEPEPAAPPAPEPAAVPAPPATPQPAAAPSPSPAPAAAPAPTATPTVPTALALPDGYTLPPGWAMLPLRQFSNGLQQIQIRDNVWVTLATVQYVVPLGGGVVGVPPVSFTETFGRTLTEDELRERGAAVPETAAGGAAEAAPYAAQPPPAAPSAAPPVPTGTATDAATGAATDAATDAATGPLGRGVPPPEP
ncbi:uncharacterized protein V1510DRAFT_410161 [Dipodascopsis tothii]|uniref:uncharacterized protein n=1 Tax=Dipodascopsis tothii TaxID=44089 RepID=UPI0034CE3C5A